MSSACTAAISIGHFGDIMAKVEEAKRALSQYDFAMQATRDRIEYLSSRAINTEKMAKFFAANYERDFSTAEPDSLTAKDIRRKERQLDAWNSFTRRFDDEREIAGATWWNAFNAYSGLVQHDLKARGADDAKRIASRINSNLFGLNADRTSAAFVMALNSAV